MILQCTKTLLVLIEVPSVTKPEKSVEETVTFLKSAF